jgi:DNA mismatch repair protein MutL
MSNIIKLLPDNIANQIAAGEVIQRPASVVKELLENAIDAGSENIKLIIKDSGKTLIQVIDDGAGMTESDARLCFERHATSKISTAEDLFHIDTKGFRGEALASIAAIAHVELVTRQHNADLATRILLAGSKIDKTEVVQSQPGTSISVKNLFFNIPARRKFLKSDPVELKHIVEEFLRLVLIHTDIHFVFHHNGNDLYYLPKSNQKQRIINIFGKNYQDKLLTVKEETDFINVSGFILKSEAAKRTAGEQYLFVNHRYVKSNYLNHAIRSSFEGLLQKDQFPGYFINIDIDPSLIDINVSPTKTEIKFEDERLAYNYLKVATKHALGVYILSPTIDFDTNVNITESVGNGSSYNFGESRVVNGGSSPRQDNYPSKSQSDAQKLEQENLKSWQQIYQGLDTRSNEITTIASQISEEKDLGNEASNIISKEPFQLHNKYILVGIKSGMMIIDQQNAHERILYEENLKLIKSKPHPTQKELFPSVLELDSHKSSLLQVLIPFTSRIGFDIGEFGKNAFIIHGVPVGLPSSVNSLQLLKEIIESYDENLELQLGVEENLARSYAQNAAVKRGTPLTPDEMKSIVDKLFGCEVPFVSPSGKKCFIDMGIQDINARFK